MERYPYTVVEQEDGTFLVEFVDVPEAFTSTADKAAIPAMAAEVLELVAEDYADTGRTLPTPSAEVYEGQFVTI